MSRTALTRPRSLPSAAILRHWVCWDELLRCRDPTLSVGSNHCAYDSAMTGEKDVWK